MKNLSGPFYVDKKHEEGRFYIRRTAPGEGTEVIIELKIFEGDF